jgi:hypothetical protein
MPSGLSITHSTAQQDREFRSRSQIREKIFRDEMKNYHLCDTVNSIKTTIGTIWVGLSQLPFVPVFARFLTQKQHFLLF